jgi:hypothetical protein
MAWEECVMSWITKEMFDSKLVEFKEIKAAVKSGLLPAGKFSVRSKYFSGGSSIDITIKNLTVPFLNLDAILWEVDHPNEPMALKPSWLDYYTEAGNKAVWTLEAILNQYNFDKSDRMTDYFFVNFYDSVGFDWEYERHIKTTLLEAAA